MEDSRTRRSQGEERLVSKERFSVVPCGPEEHGEHRFELDSCLHHIDFGYILIEDRKGNFQP